MCVWIRGSLGLDDLTWVVGLWVRGERGEVLWFFHSSGHLLYLSISIFLVRGRNLVIVLFSSSFLGFRASI